ncbi:MAG TPA: hypothetical protein VI072_01400 [Polyangiaceae bacterium]
MRSTWGSRASGDVAVAAFAVTLARANRAPVTLADFFAIDGTNGA